MAVVTAAPGLPETLKTTSGQQLDLLLTEPVAAAAPATANAAAPTADRPLLLLPPRPLQRLLQSAAAAGSPPGRCQVLLENLCLLSTCLKTRDSPGVQAQATTRVVASRAAATSRACPTAAAVRAAAAAGLAAACSSRPPGTTLLQVVSTVAGYRSGTAVLWRWLLAATCGGSRWGRGQLRRLAA